MQKLELTKRLRTVRNYPTLHSVGVISLCDEAADELTRLQSENEELTAELAGITENGLIEQLEGLQTENELLRSDRNKSAEILSRLFDGSCFDCPCLDECDKDGLAWDAYNIGTVARIDCLGAK